MGQWILAEVSRLTAWGPRHRCIACKRWAVNSPYFRDRASICGNSIQYPASIGLTSWLPYDHYQSKTRCSPSLRTGIKRYELCVWWCDIVEAYGIRRRDAADDAEDGGSSSSSTRILPPNPAILFSWELARPPIDLPHCDEMTVERCRSSFQPLLRRRRQWRRWSQQQPYIACDT